MDKFGFKGIVDRYACQIVLAIYLMLALLCFAKWTAGNLYPVTGDEPHYLVMASGIGQLGTLEQTKPYAREFEHRELYPGIMAPAGSTPTPQNTHSIKSKNGLFNVHNIGLPLLLTIPLLLGGVIGVKLFLVLVSSSIVVLAWKLSASPDTSRTQRIIIVATVMCGMPFIPASNQIYPDLPAGLLALLAIYWIRQRRSTSPWSADAAIACAIAMLPWLQIKFAAVALTLCTGLCIRSFLQSKNVSRPAIFAVALLVSLGVLAAYNSYAFDNMAGPYHKASLVLNIDALVVFLSLHIDQLHGVFFQNPAYVAGLVFLLPHIKQYRLEGTTAVVAYLGIVVPNSMHPIWYGGDCITGRFMWTGATIMLPAVLFGLSNVAKLCNGKGIYALCLAILWNLRLYIKYSFGLLEIYNPPPPFSGWPESAASLLPILKLHLPNLQDASWALQHSENWIAISLCLMLFVTGAWLCNPGRRRTVQLIGAYLVLGVLIGVLLTNLPPKQSQPLHMLAISLPTEVGKFSNWAYSAQGPQAGYVTFGPYLPLSPGQYEFDIDYSAEAEGTASPARWEIILPQERRVLRAGVLPLGNGKTRFIENLAIDRHLANRKIGIRTYYTGNNAGTLTMRSLTIRKVTPAISAQHNQAMQQQP